MFSYGKVCLKRSFAKTISVSFEKHFTFPVVSDFFKCTLFLTLFFVFICTFVNKGFFVLIQPLSNSCIAFFFIIYMILRMYSRAKYYSSVKAALNLLRGNTITSHTLIRFLFLNNLPLFFEILMISLMYVLVGLIWLAIQLYLLIPPTTYSPGFSVPYDAKKYPFLYNIFFLYIPYYFTLTVTTICYIFGWSVFFDMLLLVIGGIHSRAVSILLTTSVFYWIDNAAFFLPESILPASGFGYFTATSKTVLDFSKPTFRESIENTYSYKGFFDPPLIKMFQSLSKVICPFDFSFLPEGAPFLIFHHGFLNACEDGMMHIPSRELLAYYSKIFTNYDAFKSSNADYLRKLPLKPFFFSYDITRFADVLINFEMGAIDEFFSGMLGVDRLLYQSLFVRNMKFGRDVISKELARNLVEFSNDRQVYFHSVLINNKEVIQLMKTSTGEKSSILKSPLLPFILVFYEYYDDFVSRFKYGINYWDIFASFLINSAILFCLVTVYLVFFFLEASKR